MKKVMLLVAMIAIALAGAANAAEILVTSDITTSQIWTADNVYNLQKQIYVEPGATLTIEAGTLVRSTANVGGSLAVCRGAKIYVNGTENAPVIMTSTLDDLQNWHEGCQEWGNLTIMGDAYISASHYAGTPVGTNTKVPSASNEKQMEGLTDPVLAMYGGGNDYDDSGSITYLSLRYGGKVIGLANELNGLSMGAIGRGTDVHHIDIMNNVDDGIETWGGTVNYKYINIWNIGDDSFDVDEGWRGKAQFGLIVQGYSTDASQGSGVGDNCFETDGAEDSDAQPVTTAAIYNFTVVGQPIEGDGATAWRDNARVQYRNCIFMDCGEKVVRFDENDGDGALGYTGDKGASGDPRLYSVDGTLSWVEHWATSYADWAAGAEGQINRGSAKLADLYQSQVDGKLCEITDSVFYNNTNSNAYTEADALGIFDAANNNVKEPADSPIRQLTRGTPVIRGGKPMLPVTYINPCAANDALTSAATAPDDGFFTSAQYRGGFSGCENWLAGWTSVDAYGMTDTSVNTLTQDTNCDGTVDLVDFTELSNQWLQ